VRASRCTCALAGAGVAPNVADRLHEALVRERLEQVVDGVQLERRQGVLVVGRREDHRRLVRVAGQRLQHLQACEDGHLDVHQHEVGLQRADLRQRARAVATGCHELQSWHLRDPVGQRLGGERFVLGDQDCGEGCHCGIQRSTRKPAPG
jgi:hypothetical protein